jgi:exodeoxyribonuclease V alpha subunit
MGYQHWPMLERNLLYTANTEPKTLCLFLASKGAIERAVKNNPVKERNTYLAQRLRAYMSETADA